MHASTLRRSFLFSSGCLALLAGCSSRPSPASIQAGDAAFETEFGARASDLGSEGWNTYFVLEPGYRATFAGREGRKQVELVITVLAETEMVDGVRTRVVEERESKDGELVEVSRNFFAISKLTRDVYYFGEDVDMYEDGRIVSHEGAWRSGVDGAKYGLMMPGVDVKVGRRFHQEVAPGVALDRCEIVATDEVVTTPAGRFERCLRMKETTPLESGDGESKWYAPDVGLIRDGPLLLVSRALPR